MDRSADAHDAFAAVRREEAPLVARRRELVRQACVPREILGHARRAMAREVSGGRAAHDRRRADAARDEQLALDRADPHREVEAFVDEVDDAIGEVDVETHLRVAHRERGDHRREHAVAVGDRAGELERAARRDAALACRLLGLLEVGEELHGPLVERAPGLGERQPPCRPVEQARVEVALELGDVTGDRGHRPVESLGRPREAAALDDGDERLEVPGIGPRLHCCIISNNTSYLA
jgi:hypothetical protein